MYMRSYLQKILLLLLIDCLWLPVMYLLLVPGLQKSTVCVQIVSKYLQSYDIFSYKSVSIFSLNFRMLTIKLCGSI